jgi:class 3 adenylate cyclase/pimeloyl-ACP methyl ester carboxylesterase
MIEDPAGRQILAIMFTDVVGYTAITERDEQSAVRIREAHRDLVQTLVKQFGGEVVDVTGDESLSIFASALRAVDCAIAIQSALRSDPELRLRIGIHLGDVLRKGSEVIGEGVNVAARVRPLAEPGGICVSEPVYQMVRSRTHVAARAMGSRALKNVAEPIGVYALSASESAAVRPRRASRLLLALSAAAITVVAVFVFARGPILSWLVVNVPLLTGETYEQQIAFATTPDGVQLAYATAGEGPPVVFVVGWATHLTEGIGSPLYDMRSTGAWWTRNHRTVRFDGRGFGLSDRNVTDLSLEKRVLDLETVVDALGFDRFALYGSSAGGPTAAAYASRHPERVSRLVLTCTFAVGSRGDPAFAAEREGFSRFIDTGWAGPAARAAMAQFLAPESNEVQRRLLMHFLHVSGDGPQFAAFMQGTLATDVREQARSIRVPTLVVASDADTTVPLTSSRQLASLIPGARLEIISGAGHAEACMLDPRVMEMTAAFIAE